MILKRKYITFLFIAVAIMISCGKSLEKKSIEQNNLKDTSKVNIDVNLEIVKNGKIYYESRAQLDSFDGFLLKTSIKNLSADTFKFFMVLSVYSMIQKFEPRIKGLEFVCCDHVSWDLFYLLKNQKMEIYNCMLDPTELWYFQNNSKLRVGFIPITEEDEIFIQKNNVWNVLANKRENRNAIFWSNYVDFKEYIPTIKTNIFRGNVIIKDSLENVLSIRSGEIH